MRIFQNSGVSRGYLPRLRSLTRGEAGFKQQKEAFLADRYGASHFLKPILEDAPNAFFTNGDDEFLQRAWAQENGMKAEASLADILLAQIEAHRTEVFYSLDPVRYPSSFLARLPACVKRTVAWQAAPSGVVDLSAYGLVVNNFPSILDEYRSRGWRVAYFAPAHDPELDAYAARTERPVDVVFFGGYSRHHRNRAAVLEAVAALRGKYNVVLHLDRSRMTKLAETPLGIVGPLSTHRRPLVVRRATADPVFGRRLYEVLSSARIVLNGAVDMAGDDRGNMRCWETHGSGALLVSDAGSYPEGMVDRETMLTYKTADEAVRKIEAILAEPEKLRRIAFKGHEMISQRYSKERQWQAFEALL